MKFFTESRSGVLFVTYMETLYPRSMKDHLVQKLFLELGDRFGIETMFKLCSDYPSI